MSIPYIFPASVLLFFPNCMKNAFAHQWFTGTVFTFPGIFSISITQVAIQGSLGKVRRPGDGGIGIKRKRIKMAYLFFTLNQRIVLSPDHRIAVGIKPKSCSYTAVSSH